jgi:capsular polysaccharide biosynthesis protein
MRQDLVGDVTAVDQNVYISRRDSDRRVIVNEAAVEEYLASKGFKILVPSTVTPAAQLSALAGARIVIAPHGAGLTNMVACRSGTVIHELIHPLKGTDAYAILSGGLGLTYSFSPLIDHGNGFRGAVDMEKLDAWLLGVM